MKRFLLLLTLATGVLLSCEKEGAEENTPTARAEEKEFKACDCTPPKNDEGEPEFIKATINDVPVCFDIKPALGDTFPNMLQHGFIFRSSGRQYYDNLYMIRNAANSHWQAAIFLENSHALTKSYPYNLPRPNPEYCEIGSLQLNDRQNYVSCSWCPENRYNYSATFSGNGVRMTATRFSNNVFEGTFEGTAATGSGKVVGIKNGSFRIRLKVYSQDIVIP